MVAHPMLSGEAAEVLGLSTSRFRQLVRERRVPVAETTKSGMRLFERRVIEGLAARRREAEEGR
jgi:DNA-binding transcriptional MerR regulator